MFLQRPENIAPQMLQRTVICPECKKPLLICHGVGVVRECTTPLGTERELTMFCVRCATIIAPIQGSC